MIISNPDIIRPDPVEYGIDSETGFVALDLSELPYCYAPWKMIVSSLPELLGSKQVKSQVDTLPVLDTSSLVTVTHWRRAYVTLGYIIQAYIWEDKECPRDVVPACLSAPFLDICDHIGMKPVLSYAGLCLWNCALKIDKSTLLTPTTKETTQQSQSKSAVLSEFSQIQSYASFTGTRDEDAFNLIPVMIEFQGASLIPLLLDAVAPQTPSSSDSDLYKTLLTTLPLVVSSIKSMISLLSLLNSTCHPQTFYHDIRPLLSGSASPSSFPNGIRFIRSSTSTVQVSCIGGSAAQSPFFQFLDHMFGISHSPASTRPLILQMREYMPRSHRLFLEAVDSLPSIPDLVSQQIPDGTASAAEIQTLLRECIETLREWRSKHVNLVARYIVSPARAENKGNDTKGTAGSSPMVFLKGVRDETVLKAGN